VTVVNNGTLTRTITSAGLSVAITRNSTTVPTSQYVVTSKSVSLASHKAAVFTLTWNHGNAALHLGDAIVVSTCANQLGDEHPENNCGVKNDPAGAIAMFAWPKTTWAIKANTTSSTLGVWLTNMSSFTVRPVRVAENVTVTVQVNGGAVQTTTAPVLGPFALNPGLDTQGMGFTWAHAKLTKGDSVVVTACAVVPNNTAVPNCWSRTVIAG
jgi:nitrous oxidase accessory protein NosD